MDGDWFRCGDEPPVLSCVLEGLVPPSRTASSSSAEAGLGLQLQLQLPAEVLVAGAVLVLILVVLLAAVVLCALQRLSRTARSDPKATFFTIFEDQIR